MVRGGGEEGFDAAGGFGGADLPGGEGGDFAEVGGDGGVLCYEEEGEFSYYLKIEGGGRGYLLGSSVNGSSSVTSSTSASSTISCKVGLLGSTSLLVGSPWFMTRWRRLVVERI